MSEAELDQAEAAIPPRKLWVIILFMLFSGPLAFAYCGRLGKGVLWQLGFLAFGLLAMAGMLYTPWTRLFLGVLVVGAVLFYLAVIVTNWVSQQQQPWRHYQKWWCYGLLCLAFAVFSILSSAAVRTYWSEAFVLPTGSMLETVLPGDRILVEKLTFKFNGPQRNSIVVFRSPAANDPPDLSYVKRLLALPGDKVRMEDGVLYVNDQKLNEPYVKFLGELDTRVA
jgi:signal peptidase I